MKALSAGMLVGITLSILSNGGTVLFISLLIPTIYYNYQFFTEIFKQWKKENLK
jgi:hypothetical protein